MNITHYMVVPNQRSRLSRSVWWFGDLSFGWARRPPMNYVSGKDQSAIFNLKAGDEETLH